jgi:hypothetical protein
MDKSHVYVTNRWERTIEFPFEYRMYRFPVGETVEIPAEAAQHIFGIGDDNKEMYLSRLGIIQTKNDIPNGLKALERIEISATPPEKDRSLSPAVGRVPPDRKPGGKASP